VIRGELGPQKQVRVKPHCPADRTLQLSDRRHSDMIHNWK